MALKGHRVEGGVADWEKLAPGVRPTREQRIAAATNGWLTTPNGITAFSTYLGVTSALELARAPKRSRRENVWPLVKFVTSLFGDKADGGMPQGGVCVVQRAKLWTL